MRRLTAIALLFLATAAIFVPIAKALAISPAPLSHACCQRKSAHRCHGSGPESEELVIRDAGCCNHDCCRAVASLQWARPRPSISAVLTLTVKAFAIDLNSASPKIQTSAFQATRAPPAR
jgi:hypothetical protein